MFVWEWDGNLAQTVLVLEIKLVGCATEVAIVMEMIDATTVVAEGGRTAVTVMGKEQSSVPHVMGNNSFWFTSTSP